ncbi:hypothetical protein MHYP_G00028790 [Metynnis hypsauchen]
MLGFGAPLRAISENPVEQPTTQTGAAAFSAQRARSAPPSGQLGFSSGRSTDMHSGHIKEPHTPPGLC